MTPNPKISICIPAYEYPELLQRCLASVTSQTYRNIEVIITDDSDHYLLQKVVSEINDERICYIKNDTSLGSPANWNESLKHASGDLIMTLHHDDWFISNTAIEKFVEVFKNHPNVSFAFCQHFICYPGSKTLKHSANVSFIKRLKQNPYSLLFLNEIGPPSVVMFTRQVASVFFDTNTKWYVDVIFYAEAIAKYGEVYYLREPLINITAGSDKQVTNTTKGYIKVKEAIYSFLKFGFLTKRTSVLLQLNFIELFKRYNIRSFNEVERMGFEQPTINKLKTPFYLSKLPIHYKVYALIRVVIVKYSLV